MFSVNVINREGYCYSRERKRERANESVRESEKKCEIYVT